jgi:hypothetical protein
MSAKRTIRAWIQAHFSDEKLAEVYAFNADCKMSLEDPCGCLLGVTLPTTLHQDYIVCGKFCPDRNSHYATAKKLPSGRAVEYAYYCLGFGLFPSLRRYRLARILRAEIKRRDRERETVRRLPSKSVSEYRAGVASA